MIKKFKIIYIFLLLMITSCGYQMIYTTENINFLINEIKLSGNSEINNKIFNHFNFYKTNENYVKIYDVEVNSSLNKETSSRDKKGNTKIFKLSLNIKLNILEDNKLIKSKTFLKNSSYKSIDNKFDLKQYENNLINNMIDAVWEDIEVTLNSL